MDLVTNLLLFLLLLLYFLYFLLLYFGSLRSQGVDSSDLDSSIKVSYLLKDFLFFMSLTRTL